MFYQLEEARRIDQLRRDIDAFDRACLIGTAVNNPDGLKQRQQELRASLRHDPDVPDAPAFTAEEMRDAAQRLMTSVLASGKLVS